MHPRGGDPRAAADRLTQSLIRARSQAVIPEIAYHGVLGSTGTTTSETAESGDVGWISTQGVRFFRAIGQAAVKTPDEIVLEEAPEQEGGEPVDRSARVALLDGLPIENHQVLEGHLRVDDPDGWAQNVPADRRLHGTAMASLIVRGDLNGPGDSIGEPLYVRPILNWVSPPWLAKTDERIPPDRLPIDLVHEAVVRMFEGPQAAPDVRIINLSVGDEAQRFDLFLEPMGETDRLAIEALRRSVRGERGKPR